MELDASEFLHALPSMTWVMLADGQVNFVNRPWEEYTGFRFTTRESCRWEDADHRADLGALTAHLQAVRAS